MSPAKKTYSIEDITAALDDMIDDNPLLQGNAQANYSAGGHGAMAATPPSNSSLSADEELDALSQALKGFPPKQPRDPNKEEG